MWISGGIKKAVQHFKVRGCRVVAILPAKYLDSKAKNIPERMKPDNVRSSCIGFVSNSVLYLKVLLLRELQDDGVLYSTPNCDYDDPYTIGE